MIKEITAPPSLFEKYHKLQEEWEYIEDPTYSRSIDSHVCMTCSKFYYSSQVSCGSILCCNWHQKLIFQGQHLTHSCELYQKKTNLSIYKKLSHT
tara:strand:+ start:212 stop:496 length:285 start_codon:yes stop_codon:yes gene_type:complete